MKGKNSAHGTEHVGFFGARGGGRTVMDAAGARGSSPHMNVRDHRTEGAKEVPHGKRKGRKSEHDEGVLR